MSSLSKIETVDAVAPVTNKVKNIQKLVQSTYDYDMFKTCQGNRTINMGHKAKLLKSIQESNLMIPLIVNEKMEIIDGQHRFLCWQKLNEPVVYIIYNGYGFEEARRLNANLKIWSMDDYLRAYLELGVKDYILYNQFREQYKLSHNISLIIINKKTHLKQEQREEFMNGNLNFDSRDFQEVSKVAGKIRKGREYYPGWQRRSYIAALLRLFKLPEFDYDEYLRKLAYQRDKLYDVTTTTAYLNIIINIYNYHSPSANRISL